jgi:hypothetical protein
VDVAELLCVKHLYSNEARPARELPCSHV